jgi:hypothetical protein
MPCIALQWTWALYRCCNYRGALLLVGEPWAIEYTQVPAGGGLGSGDRLLALIGRLRFRHVARKGHSRRRRVSCPVWDLLRPASAAKLAVA